MLLPLLAAVAYAPGAAAQDPTRVAVHVQLKDAMFRLGFGPQVPQIEKRLAEVIAQQIGQRVGFVRFVPLGTEADRLTFSLDRNDRASTGHQVDRGFWVQLTQTGKPPEEVYWFTLRPAHTTSAGVGSADALVADVQSALERQDFAILQKLLKTVPVALEAMISENPLGWALPFRRDVLCMRNETELQVVQLELENQIQLSRPYEARIRAEFTRDPGPDNARFRNGLLGEPTDATLRASLQRAIQQRRVQGVTAVYVINYQPGTNCGLRAVPPDVGGGA
jgi:hypothetical protein